MKELTLDNVRWWWYSFLFLLNTISKSRVFLVVIIGLNFFVALQVIFYWLILVLASQVLSVLIS